MVGMFGNNTVTVLGGSQLTTADMQIWWSIGNPTYIVYSSIPLSSFLHLDKVLLYLIKYLMVVDLTMGSCLYMAGYSLSHSSTLPVMAALAIRSCQYIASYGWYIWQQHHHCARWVTTYYRRYTNMMVYWKSHLHSLLIYSFIKFSAFG
jgi:hypothetical protein